MAHWATASRCHDEASGTSWQPDATPEGGVMTSAGGWMLMGHALINGVYDRQQGPRGGDKTFVSGMVMGMATRTLSTGGTLQLRAVAPALDALMGPAGYPLLLASGETADGVHPLVDRQHPHDLFMELAGSYSQPLGGDVSAFVYAGLPGSEPALRAARPQHADPRREHGQPRGADQPPLAGLDAHQLRGGHRRRCAWRLEAGGLAFQRPRARPAPLGHRDRPLDLHLPYACPGTPARPPGRCRRPGPTRYRPNSSSPA